MTRGTPASEWGSSANGPTSGVPGMLTGPRHDFREGAVLLLTPTDPKSDGVGGLFLRDLMSTQPSTVFAVHREPAFLMTPGAKFPRALAKGLQALAARIPSYSSIRLRWFCVTALAKRAEAIAARARESGIRLVWVAASSPEVIWIAERLAARGLDVRVTVLDAPEYFSRNLHLDRTLDRQLMHSFSSLLRKARRVSVVGRAMQQRYREQYGISSEIIRHGIHLPTAPMSPSISDREIRIAFAGSLYSKKEWNSFMEALDLVRWSLDDRSISLQFIGRFPLSGARRPEQVNILGEKTLAETLNILATMHVGYLPYWFDKEHELAARTSFPGKLSAYAAAGLAVFHHAPAYTEATTFLEQYPFGIACPSLAAKDIVDALQRLARLRSSPGFEDARRAALVNELSSVAMEPRFGRLLSMESQRSTEASP